MNARRNGAGISQQKISITVFWVFVPKRVTE